MADVPDSKSGPRKRMRPKVAARATHSLNRLARPQQSHDPLSDIWCQTVPVCDELAECLVLPAMFRPSHRALSITAFGITICGKRDAGAIPAASTSCVINHLNTMAYVYEGRG